ncbi:hypothetical protein SDC9_170099 [bioreactor metagenome]|uniref:Sortase B n=1 Tax=bioreactor metagenome TaxID=1076179 RepID=A0A645G9C8_9ZZZZ
MLKPSFEEEHYYKSKSKTKEEDIDYESPVDFTNLQAVNPDIYAWLYVVDSNINYPILQREDDDTYYLKRDSEENLSEIGALFTEGTYNATDFSDPVTIIYGHMMRNGMMFGNLQENYSDPERFNEQKEIIVYLPDQELHYEVFASVPYDNRHILYNYDFHNQRIFYLFFNEILSIREIGANFDEGITVSPDDHVLVLSTCLKGNDDRRFLVFARLREKNGLS